MPSFIPPINNEPAQGIRAQLDLLYLWNPDVAQNLIDKLNEAMSKMQDARIKPYEELTFPVEQYVACFYGDYVYSANTDIQEKPEEFVPEQWTLIATKKEGSSASDASEVTYHNPDYPTVEAALDKLLYVAPAINSFTGGGTYEVGTKISSVALAWTLNKSITSQSINQGIGSLDVSLRGYTYTPESEITTNTTFTLTVSDGTTTKTANTSISFGKYRYWGISAKDTLEDSDIRGLANKGWYSSIALSKTSFDCSPTEQEPDGFYIYYAVPTEVTTDPTFKLNGLPNTAYVKTVKKDYVNSLGTTITYTIYRFMKDNKLTDKYELEVA